MPVLIFRSPVTTKLHPATAPVPPAGEFRVTQQFGDPDYYWSNVPNPPNPLPTHNATDIGNRRCNDPIVAMAAGIAYPIRDNATAYGAATDALGVRIDHGNGITTEYWHLSRQDVTSGQKVSAGQRIGLLGATGLGAVCHCHIEAKRNGVRIDPEPLMFGGSLEVDMLGEKTTFLREPFRAELQPLTAIREDIDDLGAAPIDRSPASGSAWTLTVIGTASGAEFRGSTEWWVYGSHNRGLLAFHSQAAQRLPTSGYTAEDLAAAKASGITAGKADMHAKSIVSAENHLAEVRGLK